MKNMTTFIRAAAAAAALTAAALPAAASAANVSQPMHYALATEMTQRYHAGGYQGSLDMTVHRDGTVSGYYTPLDGSPRPVVGGIDGSHIWLDIGGTRSVHFIGTLVNGALHAAADVPTSDVLRLDSLGPAR